MTLASVCDAIDSAIIDEFGTSADYEVLCGNELFAAISNLALSEDLYKNHLASRDEKDKSLIYMAPNIAVIVQNIKIQMEKALNF